MLNYLHLDKHKHILKDIFCKFKLSAELPPFSMLCLESSLSKITIQKLEA